MLIPPRKPMMQGLFCMTPQISEAAAGGGGGVESSSGFRFSFSFIDMTAGGSEQPLDIDPSFSVLTALPGIRTLLLRGSCNGLILFEHLELQPPRSAGSRLGYIVCNPTTKEWKAVPTCGSPTALTYPHLAFDPAMSTHFHLVQFQVDDDDGEEFLSVHAYSSETGAWSDNQIGNGWRGQVGFYLADHHPQPCPFVNGFLHLLVWDDAGQLKIAALDVQGKATGMMITEPRPALRYFGESQGQGRLHCITEEVRINNAPDKAKYKMCIWVLQDYDTQEWVLKGTLTTLEAFGDDMEFEVVDMHQDRDVVFFTHPVEHELVAYDMGSKQVSLVATFDAQKKLIGTARYAPCGLRITTPDK